MISDTNSQNSTPQQPYPHVRHQRRAYIDLTIDCY